MAGRGRVPRRIRTVVIQGFEQADRGREGGETAKETRRDEGGNQTHSQILYGVSLLRIFCSSHVRTPDSLFFIKITHKDTTKQSSTDSEGRRSNMIVPTSWRLYFCVILSLNTQ